MALLDMLWRTVVGKRRTKQRRKERALKNGGLLLHCQYCDHVFITAVSRDCHQRDAHGPNAKGKKKDTKVTPTYTPPIQPVPLFEVDFCTPHPGIRCTEKGCVAAAIPLSSLCLMHDDIAISQFESEKPKAPIERQEHSNVLALPPPTGSGIKTHAERLKEAASKGHTPQPIILDAHGEPVLPASLRRQQSELSIEAQEYLLH